MTPAPGEPGRASIGRGTRLALGAQVALAMILAVAAAVLATEVADWRYWRWDLSARGRNTIDPATLERIDNLEGELRIETFLRPLGHGYQSVSGDALGRMADLLFRVESARRGKVSVVHHDMTDPAAALEAQIALGVEGENVVVVAYRGRKSVIRVFGEVAAIDWGNPKPDGLQYLTERGIPNVYDPRTWNPSRGAFVPARLTGFYGEAGLAAAIARVSVEDEPRVLVSTGHGEPEVDGTLTTSYGRLKAELERDGFRVATWDGADGAVPPGTDVLAVLGPRQPFAEHEVQAVEDFVARGGQLVVAPGNEAPLAVAALLEPYGLAIAPGIVCEEVRIETGLVEGTPYCAVLKVDGRTMAADHPVTELMRRNGLRLQFSNTHSLRRAAPSTGVRVRDLVRSTPEAWLDQRDARTGAYDFALDHVGGETKGAVTLVALAEVDRGRSEGVVGNGGRVLAIGSAAFLADGMFAFNRDFLRAAFNWLAEREQRIDVPPRPEDATAIDVARGREIGVLSWTLTLVLPGACALIGAVVSWRRRR